MAAVRFGFPTEIRFGSGARHELAAHLVEVGVRRPLLVTDRGVAALPMVPDLVAEMTSSGLDAAVFDGVWGNPVTSHVRDGVDVYLEHRADSVVGVGGGAALDVAKAVVLMSGHPGELLDYADGGGTGARRTVTAAVPWFVAVPTTAGTGSEVGRSAVIADDETRVKHIVFSPHLLARVVFADPDLTVGLPPSVTAATGVDALTHNVEAYLARGYHPMCDGIALEGVRLVSANLARAVAEPTDIDARAAMLMASMMGAVAFQKGLGLVHSTAHALGTFADVHHGLANAVMIDHALVFNVEAVPERFSALAAAAGCPEQTAASFLGWLAELKAALDLPAGPSGLAAPGLDRSAPDPLAALAVADGCHADNPRPVTEEDFRAIFVRAFDA